MNNLREHHISEPALEIVFKNSYFPNVSSSYRKQLPGWLAVKLTKCCTDESKTPMDLGALLAVMFEFMKDELSQDHKSPEVFLHEQLRRLKVPPKEILTLGQHSWFDRFPMDLLCAHTYETYVFVRRLHHQAVQQRKRGNRTQLVLEEL
jgi:hypothetical protein